MKLNRLLTLCLGLVAAAPCVAQSPCDADLDRDGIVAGSDLAIVLGDWGPCKGCQGDVTRNGVVDGIDLAFVLTLWSGACTPVPWATVIEATPDPAVVVNTDLRERIVAAGLPWRVRDNGTNIEMVLIPPGSFNMGCSASELYGCSGNENPNHTVIIAEPFYMSRTEVPQAHWQATMGTNPSYFRESNGFPNSANRPVEQVSWNTIQGFLTSTGLRLPTEAEWEYAYRAGTTTAFHGFTGYPNGTDDDTLVGNIGWHYPSSNLQTWPVGGRAANGFGLFDMPGNVWEWVSDWYGSDYYASSPTTNPSGPATGTARVLRGGSWSDYTYDARSSDRDNFTPDYANSNVGFRVARNP